MKSNWEHQKRAVTTDQKFKDDDQHIHEADKRHLTESEEHPNVIPTKAKRPKAKEDEGD